MEKKPVQQSSVLMAAPFRVISLGSGRPDQKRRRIYWLPILIIAVLASLARMVLLCFCSIIVGVSLNNVDVARELFSWFPEYSLSPHGMLAPLVIALDTFTGLLLIGILISYLLTSTPTRSTVQNADAEIGPHEH